LSGVTQPNFASVLHSWRKALRVGAIFESHDDIICVADDDHIAPSMRRAHLTLRWRGGAFTIWMFRPTIQAMAAAPDEVPSRCFRRLAALIPMK